MGERPSFIIQTDVTPDFICEGFLKAESMYVCEMISVRATNGVFRPEAVGDDIKRGEIIPLPIAPYTNPPLRPSIVFEKPGDSVSVARSRRKDVSTHQEPKHYPKTNC